MYLFSIQSSNVIKINYELLEFISKTVKNRLVANSTKVIKTRLSYYIPIFLRFL